MTHLTSLATHRSTISVVLDLKQALDTRQVIELLLPQFNNDEFFYEQLHERIGHSSGSKRNANWIYYLQCIVHFLEIYARSAPYDITLYSAILNDFSLCKRDAHLLTIIENKAKKYCIAILSRTLLVNSKRLENLDSVTAYEQIIIYRDLITHHSIPTAENLVKSCDWMIEKLIVINFFLTHPNNSETQKIGHALSLIDDFAIKQCSDGFRARISMVLSRLDRKHTIDQYLHTIRFNSVEKCAQDCLYSEGANVNGAMEVHYYNNFFMSAKQTFNFDVHLNTDYDRWASVQLRTKEHEKKLKNAIKTYHTATIIQDLLWLLRAEFVDRFGYDGMKENGLGEGITEGILHTLRSLFEEFKSNASPSVDIDNLFPNESVFIIKYEDEKGRLYDVEPDDIWIKNYCFQDVNWKGVMGTLVTYLHELKFIVLREDERCFLNQFFYEELSLDLFTYSHLPLFANLTQEQSFMSFLFNESPVLNLIEKFNTLRNHASIPLHEFDFAIRDFSKKNFATNRTAINTKLQQAMLYFWLMDERNNSHVLDFLARDCHAYSNHSFISTTIAEGIANLFETEAFSLMPLLTLQTLICLTIKHHPQLLDPLISNLTHLRADEIAILVDFKSNNPLTTAFPSALELLRHNDGLFTAFFPLLSRLPGAQARTFFLRNNNPRELTLQKNEFTLAFITQLNWVQRIDFLNSDLMKELQDLEATFQGITAKFKNFFETLSDNLYALYFKVDQDTHVLLHEIIINLPKSEQIELYTTQIIDQCVLLNSSLFIYSFILAPENLAFDVIQTLIDKPSLQTSEGYNAETFIYNLQLLMGKIIMQHPQLLEPLVLSLTKLSSKQITRLLDVKSNRFLIKKFPIISELFSPENNQFIAFLPLINRLPPVQSRSYFIVKNGGGSCLINKPSTEAFIRQLSWSQRIEFLNPDLMNELQRIEANFPGVIEIFKDFFELFCNKLKSFYFNSYESTEHLIINLLLNLPNEAQIALYTSNNGRDWLLLDKSLVMKSFVKASKQVTSTVLETLVKNIPFRICKELDNSDHGGFLRKQLVSLKHTFSNLLPFIFQKMDESNNSYLLGFLTKDCYSYSKNSFVSSIIVDGITNLLDTKAFSLVTSATLQILICLTIKHHSYLLRPLISSLAGLTSDEIAILVDFKSNRQLIKIFPRALELLEHNDRLFTEFFPLLSRLPGTQSRTFFLLNNSKSLSLPKNEFTLAFIAQLNWLQRIDFLNSNLMKELQSLEATFQGITAKFENFFETLNDNLYSLYFHTHLDTHILMHQIIINLSKSDQVELYTTHSACQWALLNSSLLMFSFSRAPENLAFDVIKILITKPLLLPSKEHDTKASSFLFTHTLQVLMAITAMQHPQLFEQLVLSLTKLSSKQITKLLNFKLNQFILDKFPMILELFSVKNNQFIALLPLINRLPPAQSRAFFIDEASIDSCLVQNDVTEKFIEQFNWTQRIEFLDPNLMNELEKLEANFPGITEMFKDFFEPFSDKLKSFYFNNYVNTEDLLYNLLPKLPDEIQIAFYTMNRGEHWLLLDSSLFMESFINIDEQLASVVLEYLIKKIPIRICKELDSVTHGIFFQKQLVSLKDKFNDLLPLIFQNSMDEPIVLQNLLRLFNDVILMQDVIKLKLPNGKPVLYALAVYPDKDKDKNKNPSLNYRTVDLVIWMLQQCSIVHQAMALLVKPPEEPQNLVEQLFKKEPLIILKLNDLILKFPLETQQRYANFFTQAVLTPYHFCTSELLENQEQTDYFRIATQSFIKTIFSSELYTPKYKKIRQLLNLNDLILTASDHCKNQEFLKTCLEWIVSLKEPRSIVMELLVGENKQSQLRDFIFNNRPDLIPILSRFTADIKYSLISKFIEEKTLNAYSLEVISAILTVINGDKALINMQAKLLLKPCSYDANLLTYILKQGNGLTTIILNNFKKFNNFITREHKTELLKTIGAINEMLDSKKQFEEILFPPSSLFLTHSSLFLPHKPKTDQNDKDTILNRSSYL